MITAPTIRYDIFIAGDLETARQACREYCLEVGRCVTVEPISYIYTGGEEAGVRVGIINYPRFQTTSDDLKAIAENLADMLMRRLCQHSYSIVGPDETVWFSRRPDASPRPAAADAGVREALTRVAKLEEVLDDLLSWFDKPSEPEWRIKSGPYGADDAVEAARAALSSSKQKDGDTPTNTAVTRDDDEEQRTADISR